MKSRFLVLLSCVSCLSWFPPWFSALAADPLTEALQKGLLEEEVNRDLSAAVQAYEAAVKQADAQRQAAATAVFRLAESYRKLGRTNEAVAQYRRVLDQFGDQAVLVGLSQTSLARLAPEPVVTGSPRLTPAALRQKELLEQELALVQEQLQHKRSQVEAGVAPRDDLIALQREALALQRQIVEVESRVRPDLLDITLPTPTPDASAATESLREEIALVGKQVADLEARSADRGATAELDKARGELLRLQRQLPENAEPARQQALLDEAITLARRQVTNTALLVQAGRAPVADEVQARRTLLALERELNSFTQTPAAITQTGTGDAAALAAAAQQLAAQLAAIEQLEGDPAKQAFAVLALEPDDSLKTMLQNLRRLQEQEAAFQANPDAITNGLYAVQGATLFFRSPPEGSNTNALGLAAAEVARQLIPMSRRVRFLLDTQRAKLALLEAAGAPAAPRVSPSSADPADVASLREEIALVEQELETNRRKFQNGKAEATELRRSQKELLRLQRHLPENASRERQTALLEEELKLAEENLEEVRRRIQVGTAAPLDEVPYRREMLAIQRELRAVERAGNLASVEPALTPALSHPMGEGAGTLSPSLSHRMGEGARRAGEGSPFQRAATQEEAAEIARLVAIIQNSPDLVNARNATQSSGTPLHKAADNGYVVAAEFLLANHADVDARDGQGRTPLYVAASAGHKRLCELLLAKGATVNAPDDRAYTPLHRAVIGGYLAVAETLIAAGAEVNTKGFVPAPDRQPREGQPNWAEMETTPLHSAAEKGFPALIELLVKHGADLNARDRGGRTPLIRAVFNQPATARLLLEKGADVNAEDGEEQTALAYAVVNQNLPMIQLLLEHQADTEVRVASGNNDFGWTTLFEPVGKGRVDVARLLLDRGANINAEGTTGLRPVHWAVIQNAPATLKLLLERNAEVNVRDTGGNTPLHYALEFPTLSNVEALLEAGADPNARGWNGGEETNWPPLLVAVRPDAERSPAPLVDWLLKHSAEVNARLTNGWTALHRAVQFNRADLAEMLIEHQADVNARGSAPKSEPFFGARKAKAAAAPGRSRDVPIRTPRTPQPGQPGVAGVPPMVLPPMAPGMVEVNFGNRALPADKDVTPLHVAVANLNLNLAKSLIAHSADVNARDADGRTPLHFAVNRRDLELMRLLLDAKADPDAKDATGWTPSRWAADVPGMRSMLQTPDGRSFWQAERKDILDLLAEHGVKDSTITNAAPAAGISPAPAPPATQGVARVLGEVKRPGTVNLGIPRKDIIDAIAECGGFTEKASFSQVEFTRGGVTRKFTLDQLKAETDPAKKIWLEPGDLIEVKARVF